MALDLLQPLLDAQIVRRKYGGFGISINDDFWVLTVSTIYVGRAQSWLAILFQFGVWDGNMASYLNDPPFGDLFVARNPYN